MKRKRPLGQNFLKDEAIAQEIVRLASIQPSGQVVEIGPGRGILTQYLLPVAGKVLALEVDPKLCAELRRRFSAHSNFELVEADALKYDYGAAGTGYQVVSNLPYYAATHILKRLIHYKPHIRDMTLMLQREVVDRLVAQPGTRNYGSLSVFTQYHCLVERVLEIGRESFAPPPKVSSSLIRVIPRQKPVVEVENPQTFFRLVHAAFFHKRKTLKNNLKDLKKAFHVDLKTLEASGLDLSRRAETLSLQDFAALANLIQSNHE